MADRTWSYVTLDAYRRTDYMVIRPRIGGGWTKVCVCKTKVDVELIISAVNGRIVAEDVLEEVRDLTRVNK